MRKYSFTYISAIIFVALILIGGGLCGTSLAATATLTKTTVIPSPPNVILNNQQLSFEVPPIIENGRTMVPLRAIFEAMGAKVNWDETTRTVTATKGTTTVVLPIGSNLPTVNGAVVKLDVPAKIIKDRTLAPLRFVGEAFGGNVGWDDSNRTVNIQSPLKMGSVVVALTVGPTMVNLRSGPDRSSAVIGSAVPGERLAVLDEHEGWYQVIKGSQKAWAAGWVVDVTWQEKAPTTPEVPPNVEVPAEPVPKLEKVRLALAKDTSGLKIIMESDVKLETTRTEAAGKVIYEFANVQIEGNSTVQQYLGSQLLTAQASQHDNSVQVVIQFPADIEYTTSSENGGQRKVFAISNMITNVGRKTFGSSGENITVNTIAPLTYTTVQTDNRLEITLSNALPGEARTTYKYDSPLISSINVKPTSTAANQTVFTVFTTKPAKFSVGLSSDGLSLNILMIDKSELQPRVPSVVLDAGHGGKDPGSSGYGLKEKDVNLDVVLRVGQILTQQGIKVIYTRNSDTFLELNEISDIANICNASLFVSVHSNSNLNPDPSGTETYCYYPIDNPLLYLQKDERYNLASLLQQALVAKLGRADRGVKQANFAVLRNSEMPSALVELAFISNPAENELLKQESFKAGAAQAIANAIQGYMKQYPAAK